MNSLKRRLATSCALAAASLCSSGLWAGDAYAQAVGSSPQPSSPATATEPTRGASPAGDGRTVDEVVVTGSLIRGTPEGAALPVDVIGADELARQGAPTILELLKNLPGSSGVLGDTNQFDARGQGTEGSGSVNLRGLGPQRTLVLLNGRRLAINPFGLAGAGVVDTNIIPAAAIDRIEVLKDGAAATYGSDAVAGVVNFITKKRFQGFDVGGSYKYVDGSNGDYDTHVNYGWSNDRADILISAAYSHRSELPSTARDFSFRPYLQNPEGGWSTGGSPGDIFTLAGAPVRDAQCGALGSYPGFSGATPACFLHYIGYDNLVETEDRIQLFGQINFDLNEHHHFHLDALYAHTDVPDWKTSPSYLPLANPTADVAPSAALAGRYFVPRTNPGLIAYVAANPSAAGLAGGGLLIPGTFRPYGVGGNPEFGNGPSIGDRTFEAYRISGGFNGDLGFWGLGYDVNLSYSQEKGNRTGYDTLVDRFALALQGLGGPNCNRALNTPGQNGCLYFNPFSNAISVNTLTGETNPQYNPALANSAELTRWFFQKLATEQVAKLFVAEGAISGKTALTLPGGPVAFAVGSQYRRNYFDSAYNDNSNLLVNPCLNTPDFGVTNCSAATRNGPFSFLGGGTPVSLENDVYAFFGELQIPLFDTLQGQFAARYENYGGQTGSTFNPKFSLRWQVVPQFALRGSIGTTFRGPPLTQLSNNPVTSLQSILGSFRAVDIAGDPNLQPESAMTFSVGGVLSLGGLKATVDYWSIDIDKGIVAEPVAGLVNTLFPNGAAGANNCGNPAFAAIQAKFTFNGACGTTTIGRLRTPYVNGPRTKTSGIDIIADYRVPQDVFGGRVTVGTTLSYAIDYKIDATTSGGVTIAPAFDAVGLLNYQTVAYPIPQIKADAYAEYRRGRHSLRYTMHYIDGYTDQRTAPFNVGQYRDTAANPVTISAGKEIEAFVTHNITYQVMLPWETTATLTLENLTDEDPPFARLDLSYDPFTGNALGRTVKVGFNKKF